MRIIAITIKPPALILKWSKTKHKTGLYAVVYLIKNIYIYINERLVLGVNWVT